MTTESLLARAHRARMEVRRIEADMRACKCQHESALEHCTASVVGDGLWWRELTDRDGKRYQREDQNGKMLEDWQPCWKGKMVPSGNPYPLPPMEWEAYGWSEERPGGWCGPCRKRETIRKGLEPARRHLAGLKSAVWAAAKKCAEMML